MTEDDTVVVHIAEAGENRGRVVLQLASAAPNRIAVEAALRVARAYQASLESIYIEDQRLIDLAMHEGASEVSLCGRDRRSLSAVAIMRQFAHAARLAERRIAAMARVADIPYVGRSLRDTPLHALNRACAESGPWNVIAFADPVETRDREQLFQLMDDLTGVTGFMFVGPEVKRTHGPIVLVVEDRDRLGQMLRIADRLAAETDDTITALLAPATDADAQGLDHDIRLLGAERTNLRVVVAPSFGEPGALAEALRRLDAGFAIGQAGRALVPRDQTWIALGQSLGCPLFVTR